jgi:HEAT repeat protein
MFLALVLAVAGLFRALSRREAAPAAPATLVAAGIGETGAARPAESTSAREPARDASVAAVSAEVGATTAPWPMGEAAEEAINELIVTYDAAAVPALARFLKHPVAEIRASAREGLVQLGERAAIPYLQEAARQAPLEEIKELLEAAEFLALPTREELREQLKKAAEAGR